MHGSEDHGVRKLHKLLGLQHLGFALRGQALMRTDFS